MNFNKLRINKLYAGSDLQRLYGLDKLLNDCSGSSILDIGMAKGLVSYEFARNGASKCHGMDINKESVNFCNTLFHKSSLDFKFIHKNLAEEPQSLNIDFPEKYDIVLLLGVWKKVERQMNNKNKFMDFICSVEEKTSKYLAIRTTSPTGSKYIPKGFKLIGSHIKNGSGVGMVNIFERKARV